MTIVTIDSLAVELKQRLERQQGRVVVAIVGPPGAGKSTLSEHLHKVLNADGKEVAVIVPMDGFHLDNVILDARGLRKRKGSPPTFDCTGFSALLDRLSRETEDVVIPVFDRSLDLARAGASIVKPDHQLLLVEGNYLLLDEEPWSRLGKYFDLTVYLDVPLPVLEQRLIQRWLDHGYDEEGARERALSNDIPNAEYVIARSRKADLIVRQTC